MANVVEIRGADVINRLLRELPKQLIASKTGGLPAKALRKGAQVIFEYEKPLLERAIAENGDESTGLLIKNFKIRRGKAKPKEQRVTIGAGKKKYKVEGKTVVGKNGKERPVYKKGANTALNAARLEYGTSQQAPCSFARTAFSAKAELAISTTTDYMLKELERLAKKHLPQER